MFAQEKRGAGGGFLHHADEIRRWQRQRAQTAVEQPDAGCVPALQDPWIFVRCGEQDATAQLLGFTAVLHGIPVAVLFIGFGVKAAAILLAPDELPGEAVRQVEDSPVFVQAERGQVHAGRAFLEEEALDVAFGVAVVVGHGLLRIQAKEIRQRHVVRGRSAPAVIVQRHVHRPFRLRWQHEVAVDDDAAG